MSPTLINGLFSLAGVVLGVIGTWAITYYSATRRRMTVYRSPIARLLDVGESVRSDVAISYRGEPVKNLYGGECAIQNTGNVSIEGVSVRIIPADDTPLIEAEVSSANFRIEGSRLALTEEGDSYLIKAPYMNPKDRFSIAFRAIGAGTSPEVDARLQDVEVNFKRDFVSWVPDIYAEKFMEAISKNRLLDLYFRLLKPYRKYLESKREDP